MPNFNLFDVKPDYKDLIGAMFVVARQRIARDEYKRVFSFVGEDEKVVDIKRYAETVLGPEILIGKSRIYLTKASLSSIIDICAVDGYDAGWVKNKSEWDEKLDDVEKGYLLEYNRQSNAPQAQITEMDSDSGKILLNNLCTHIQEAVKANNPIAQIRAETTLKQWLTEPQFQPLLEGIIKAAGCENPNRQDIIDNRILTIFSLRFNKYNQAANLQRNYEQLVTGKV
jgi:hypothetical protein